MKELLKADCKIILDLITPGASVLDLGCGHGKLLQLLVEEKNVKGQGIEIDKQCIYDCVAKGLSVLQGDFDTGLSEYGDKSFDYVILNQTFQQVKNPDFVLQEAIRVAGRVIVGFPNFVYYKGRFQLFFKGRVPVFPALPYEWYSTPNLHFLSLYDFIGYCHKKNIKIEKSVFYSGNKTIRLLPNFFAQDGIFLITKQKERG